VDQSHQFSVTNNSLIASEEEQKRPSEERELIKFLSDGQIRTASYLDACDWYVQFIDSKYRAHWRAIRSFVEDVKKDTLTPDADDIPKVDKVLAAIAKDLSKKEGYALSDIEDLINQKLIIDYYADEREASHQLMFILLGWLSRCQKPFLFL
jgi:hypothetical protein